jgi:hypothetical protein
VYVDGAVTFEQSGEDRIGRVSRNLTAGTHNIRFAYEKDASGSAGRDTAQIDDVTVKSSRGHQIFRFETASLAAPEGWSTGGAGGGWTVARPSIRRGLQRPVSAAFAGYNPNGLVSSTERTLTWPAGASKNQLKIGYLVESEESRDVFRVYVDGIAKFSMSGREREGVATIDVGAPGAHVVRFAYEKDESVDEGLDDARVLRMEAISDGNAFQILDLDAAELGAAPPGWSAADPAHANWTITGSMTALAQVPAGDQPTVDGLRESAYRQGSRLFLGDLATLATSPAKLAPGRERERGAGQAPLRRDSRSTRH